MPNHFILTIIRESSTFYVLKNIVENVFGRQNLVTCWIFIEMEIWIGSIITKLYQVQVLAGVLCGTTFQKITSSRLTFNFNNWKIYVRKLHK